MNYKPIAIVLGGTTPHIALIENLKTRGYYTVLVDYLENPPAKPFADEHIQESTLDKDKVLDIAKNLNASLVISACIDQANVTACYVAEKLGLPKPYSYDIALNVTNKGKMKEILKLNNISTSNYIYINSLSEFEQSNLKFPLIVKPADSCGSSGVKIIQNKKDLVNYFEFAKRISRIGKVIIEEVVQGKEISAYCFIEENFDVHVIMLSQRLSKIEGQEEVLKCYATITTPEISEKSHEIIKLYAKKIAKVFNLKNTPLHLQVFVNNDEVHVIEFAPRAGGGISYNTIYNNTGFDMINSVVDSFLNKKVNVVYSMPKFFYAINIIYAYDGIFKRIDGQDRLLQNKVIEDIFLYKSFGSVIKNDTSSHCRIGAYIIKAETKKELVLKIKKALNNICVCDIDDKPIINKEIYDSFENLI